MRIEINNESLDLGGDFTMQTDDTSPVMNDRGSQTVPVTIPCTPHNVRLVGFPHRLDADVQTQNLPCKVVNGAYIRSGTMNIVQASPSAGITLNIGFDNSEAYAQWKDSKLRTLVWPVVEYESVTALCQHMTDVCRGTVSAPYEVFTVQLSNETHDDTPYPIYLNELREDENGNMSLVCERRTATQLINGTPSQVTLPEGYGVAPFLKVGETLRLLFEGFGYTLSDNPFADDAALSQLVLLHNTADVCVRATLNYSDLLPDCTVQDLLNALYVRFGMVYTINSDTKTARIRLIRDIIADSPAEAIDAFITSRPSIIYSTPRQLVLSAKTSLEGAAPPSPRLEDFYNGASLDVIYAQWEAEVAESPTASYMWARNTNNWLRYDTATKEERKVKRVGSSFFDWDRQTPGVDNEELASDDECVAVDQYIITTSGWATVIIVPLYLCGTSHRHTYVANAKSKDAVTTNAPLAFSIAFPHINATSGLRTATFGSSFPYDAFGTRMQIGDGYDFPFSLSFQFTDGLFAQFWRGYDAILRHAWRTVEVEARMPMPVLKSADMLTPVALHGQRLLYDKMQYTLPAGADIPVALTLRTLRLHDADNIDIEQGITHPTEMKTLRWTLLSDNFQTALDAWVQDCERQAVTDAAHDYPGDYTSSTTPHDVEYTKSEPAPSTDTMVIEEVPPSEGGYLHRTYHAAAKVSVSVLINGQGSSPSRWVDYHYETADLDYTATWIAV